MLLTTGARENCAHVNVRWNPESTHGCTSSGRTRTVSLVSLIAPTSSRSLDISVGIESVFVQICETVADRSDICSFSTAGDGPFPRMNHESDAANALATSVWLLHDVRLYFKKSL